MTSVWQKPHNINNTITPYFNFIFVSKKYLSNLNFATTTSIQFLHGSETAAVDDHGAVHGAGQTALTTYHLGQDEEHFNINILLFVFPRLLKLHIIPSKRGQTSYRRAEESRDRGRTSSSSLVCVSTLSTLSRPHHGAVFMGAVVTLLL